MNRLACIVSILAILGCKTSSKNVSNKNPEDTADRKFEKFEAQSLSAFLHASDFEVHNLSGLMLYPKLDPRASYIDYEICRTESKGKNTCVNGVTDGLMPEAVYNAPQGELTISYRACLVAWRALGEPCGKKQTSMVHHLSKNMPSLRLVPVKVEEKVLGSLRKSVYEWENQVWSSYKYLDHGQKISDAQHRLLQNLLSMDPYVLARIVDSQAFRKKLRETKHVQAKAYLTGASFLSLGSHAQMKSLFQEWKFKHASQESAPYVEAVEKSIDRFLPIHTGGEAEDLSSILSLIHHSGADEWAQLVHMQELARIEKECMHGTQM